MPRAGLVTLVSRLTTPITPARGKGVHSLRIFSLGEAKFEPNSYGFRVGRSCHDAIEAIFITINQKAKYVLDADITKCVRRDS